MTTAIDRQSEYRNLPLAQLQESPANPRRIFDGPGLEELAASIRAQGVLSPLLVRPVNGTHGYEIVAGARRYRAAQRAELATVPVRIVNLSDAEALEAMLIENLQRSDLHPLHEAAGFRALLDLEEPKYCIEQISARTGKKPAYIAAHLKLTELAPAVTEAFAKDEIGVGHALLLATLQRGEQEQALPACYQDVYGNGSKPRRVLLPVRHLRDWIEHNIMLDLATAPFSKDDAQLVPEAGACVDCPKQTGHNNLLFSEWAGQHGQQCTDPACYQRKIDAYVQQTVTTKPKLVQISTVYGKPADGSSAIPRNKYVEIRQDKPKGKHERDWPEYRTCKYATEAMVTEGTEKGETKKVCINPECPVHHPKRQDPRTQADAAFKAEQEKRRREEAIAQTTGMRVLKAIGEAIPVRLMKRDLLFLAERLTAMLDERRLSVLIRQHSIGKPKDDAAPVNLLAVFLAKAEESKLGRIVVETVILLAMHDRADTAKLLRDAAQVYKVDVDAISAQVRQEFAAKDKGKSGKKAAPKPQPRSGKKAAA
jgi:ParB family transcriptional regulator, chromosome partitioning protein